MNKYKKIFTITLYIILISIILSIFIIKYFSTKIKPTLNRYVTAEIERIITLIINDTINNDLTNIDTNSVFITNNKDTIDLDNKKINDIQKKINNHIEKNIRLVSSGKIKELDKYINTMSHIDYETIDNGLVYYISTGNISGSIFTNNIGPKIPLKFNISGNTVSNISNNVKEYGINNALIEIKINIKVNMIIDMPYVTKKITIKTSMPLITRIKEGPIPDYYIGKK